MRKKKYLLFLFELLMIAATLIMFYPVIMMVLVSLKDDALPVSYTHLDVYKRQPDRLYRSWNHGKTHEPEFNQSRVFSDCVRYQ